MLSVIMLNVNGECLWRISLCLVAILVRVNVLSVVMLSVFMQGVVILNVSMLSIVAPRN